MKNKENVITKIEKNKMKKVKNGEKKIENVNLNI